jgi:hypothetical protein
VDRDDFGSYAPGEVDRPLRGPSCARRAIDSDDNAAKAPFVVFHFNLHSHPTQAHGDKHGPKRLPTSGLAALGRGPLEPVFSGLKTFQNLFLFDYLSAFSGFQFLLDRSTLSPSFRSRDSASLNHPRRFGE